MVTPVTEEEEPNAVAAEDQEFDPEQFMAEMAAAWLEEEEEEEAAEE